MGFFDRFNKPKKDEKQEENKRGQELSASEKLSADLKSQINDLYKEKNDAYQEQMNEWYKTEQEIQGQLAARSDSSTTKYLDDVVAEQTRKFVSEMAEENFSKRVEPQKNSNESMVTAEKAKAINKQFEKIDTDVFVYIWASGGLGFANPIQYLGLAFLLAKEQLGILEEVDEAKLNAIRNTIFSEEKLEKYLEKELSVIKKYRMERTSNSVGQQKIIDFAIDTVDNYLDSLHVEKSQARK